MGGNKEIITPLIVDRVGSLTLSATHECDINSDQDRRLR